MAKNNKKGLILCKLEVTKLEEIEPREPEEIEHEKN